MKIGALHPLLLPQIIFFFISFSLFSRFFSLLLITIDDVPMAAAPLLDKVAVASSTDKKAVVIMA